MRWDRDNRRTSKCHPSPLQCSHYRSKTMQICLDRVSKHLSQNTTGCQDSCNISYVQDVQQAGGQEHALQGKRWQPNSIQWTHKQYRTCTKQKTAKPVKWDESGSKLQCHDQSHQCHVLVLIIPKIHWAGLAKFLWQTPLPLSHPKTNCDKNKKHQAHI